MTLVTVVSVDLILILREDDEIDGTCSAVDVDLASVKVAVIESIIQQRRVSHAAPARHFGGENVYSFIIYNSVLITMETFRGKEIIIPRSRDWKLIDETNKYSGEQRKKCQTETGKECSLYPFPAGMAVLKMFKPKRWLDPTAGWGDRLRCAIEYGCEYTGVDSNKEMKSAYQAIITDKAADSSKYEIKIGKFQNVRLNGLYDLVFTSPPFFTKEIYQHMVQWSDVQDFIDEFLKPLFKKSFKHLEVGGHLVLYIEDKGVPGFIDLMKGIAEEMLTYEGCFYYEGSRGTLRPYYVWLKK